MSKLRVELVNLPNHAARGAMEGVFTQRLLNELGGPGDALQAYRVWTSKTKPGMTMDELMLAIRWESAHAKAACAAFDGCAEPGQAFFLIHIA